MLKPQDHYPFAEGITMPTFKDYAQNGTLLGTREETLNVGNAERYLEENGVEVMNGYKDALTDFIREIDSIIYIYRPTSIGQQSDARIRAGLIKLLEGQKKFLEMIQSDKRPENSPKP